MSATHPMAVARDYVVERKRDGATEYLSLQGPFEYPRWGPASNATPLTAAKAMQYAECLLPHLEAPPGCGGWKLMAVSAQDVMSRQATSRY